MGNDFSRVLTNKNRLLTTYAGATGGKTGYTSDAGRCLVCERCARRDAQPCRFPEKLRYSLESLGANVGALVADKLGAPLQWGTKDAPPEYFVLVGAMLTKGE